MAQATITCYGCKRQIVSMSPYRGRLGLAKIQNALLDQGWIFTEGFAFCGNTCLERNMRDVTPAVPQLDAKPPTTTN